MTVIDPVNQCFSCHFSHFLNGDMHGRKHWRDVLSDVNVIHADYGNIGRNAVPGFFDSTYCTDCSNIIHTEKSSNIRSSF